MYFTENNLAFLIWLLLIKREFYNSVSSLEHKTFLIVSLTSIFTVVEKFLKSSLKHESNMKPQLECYLTESPSLCWVIVRLALEFLMKCSEPIGDILWQCKLVINIFHVCQDYVLHLTNDLLNYIFFK